MCRSPAGAARFGVWISSVAFHPHLPILVAVVADESAYSDDSLVQLWELDADRLLARSVMPSVRYTTAKIVLVGESGVGKTGLGWRACALLSRISGAH
jgi:hypothetical protein